MPELPEVETVRRGLAAHVTDRTIAEVATFHPRAIRRHQSGKKDFVRRLVGRKVELVDRRGKFLWLPFESDALIIHLGMSGQCLMLKSDSPKHRHERIRIKFADSGDDLVFIDQRTFGGMQLDELVATEYGEKLPNSVTHIARDLFDPRIDLLATAKKLRTRNTEVKRALLDQTLVSGIGNIYADEALWLARINPIKPASSLTLGKAVSLLTAANEVMKSALAQGGTSFDSLYVNVNGESGYFGRDLNVYGREGEPCPRCARPIRRQKFTNRSSHLCPRCQPAPKR